MRHEVTHPADPPRKHVDGEQGSAEQGSREAVEHDDRLATLEQDEKARREQAHAIACRDAEKQDQHECRQVRDVDLRAADETSHGEHQAGDHHPRHASPDVHRQGNQPPGNGLHQIGLQCSPLLGRLQPGGEGGQGLLEGGRDADADERRGVLLLRPQELRLQLVQEHRDEHGDEPERRADRKHQVFDDVEAQICGEGTERGPHRATTGAVEFRYVHQTPLRSRFPVA
jgi:hypothetical protein